MTEKFSTTARALLGQSRAAWARNYQAFSRYGYPRIVDTGTQWSLRKAAELLPFSWARDLAAETRNKHHAFSEFQNTKRRIAGEEVPRTLFCGEPSFDIWRAEGLGARLARLDREPAEIVPLAERCSRLGIAPSFLVPVHTGAGLTLAEATLRKFLRGGRLQGLIEEMIADLETTVQLHSEPGLRSAVFEALGLVLQTMHPDLLDPVADHLREREFTSSLLLWHGAGRGHYFDPFDFVLPSSLRGHTFLSATDDAGLNRLAGYAWAVAMVNLRSPATAATILASLPLTNDRSLAAAADGVSAATLLWLAMTDDRARVDHFHDALAARDLFPSPHQGAAIRAALARRCEAHPASTASLGSLFSYDPANGDGEATAPRTPQQ